MIASTSVKIASDSALASSSAFLAVSAYFSRLPFYILNLLFFGYFLFLWAFMITWVGSDSVRRGVNQKWQKWYQVLVLVFSFPGLLLYLLLRPSLTLEEKKRAEMEEEILRLELEKLKRESGK